LCAVASLKIDVIDNNPEQAVAFLELMLGAKESYLQAQEPTA